MLKKLNKGKKKRNWTNYAALLHCLACVLIVLQKPLQNMQVLHRNQELVVMVSQNNKQFTVLVCKYQALG